MSSRGNLLFLLANAVGSLAGPVVRDTSASNSSIAPAATTVSTSSPAGIDLFNVEAIQLTDEVLETVSAQTNETDVRAVFGFDDAAPSSRLARRSGSCKVYPGDWNYPQPLIWSIFDLLLGGALIKTIPVAAPCYNSSGVYDAAKCADISARFTIADLQYVNISNGN